MSGLDDILQQHDDINEEELKKFLSGSASEDELRAIEASMADSDFISDAVEGLQSVESKEKIDSYVAQLNKKLQQQLEAKKNKKKKRKIQNLFWVIVAVLVVLFLCAITFYVIKLYRDKKTAEIKTEVVVRKEFRC